MVQDIFIFEFPFIMLFIHQNVKTSTESIAF